VCALLVPPVHTALTRNRLLTGVKLDTPAHLQDALRILHIARRVPHVVISSHIPTPEVTAGLPSSVRGDLREPNGVGESSPYAGDTQLVICSSLLPEAERKGEHVSTVHVGSVKRIRGYFSGVGDLFSALVLAHFHPTAPPPAAPATALSRATSLATASVQSILISTHHYVQSLPEDERPQTDPERDAKDVERRVKRMRARELRLVQGRDYIVHPTEEKGEGRMTTWEEFWEGPKLAPHAYGG